MSDRVAETLPYSSERYQKMTSMSPAEFEPAIPARPQTHVLEGAATGIGDLVGLAKENKLIKRHGVSNFKIDMEYARLKLALLVHTKAVRQISFISC
jgi:hypothetical protein